MKVLKWDLYIKQPKYRQWLGKIHSIVGFNLSRFFFRFNLCVISFDHQKASLVNSKYLNRSRLRFPFTITMFILLRFFQVYYYVMCIFQFQTKLNWINSQDTTNIINKVALFTHIFFILVYDIYHKQYELCFISFISLFASCFHVHCVIFILFTMLFCKAIHV